MITLTGTYGKADEATPTGYVDIQPMVTAVRLSTIITQAPVRADLDNGAISVDIVASDDAGWDNGPIPYVFTERVNGQSAQWMAYVNGPGPVDMADLIPLDLPPDMYIPVPGPPGEDGGPGPWIADDEPTDPEIVEWFDTNEDSVRGVLNSGDTMTGPLILSGDATDPLGATTKQQLDAVGDSLIRITRPNIDDRLVEQWNGSAWSVVDYDSGWRNVLNDATATGGTVTAFKVRRQNSRVLVDVGFSDKTSAGKASWSATAGFRSPSGYNYAQLTSRTASTGDLYVLSSTTWSPYAIQFSWNAGGYNSGGGLFTGGLTQDPIPTSLPGTLITPAPQ